MREEGDFDVSIYSSAVEAILDITEKHPLREEQARMIADRFNEDWDVVRATLSEYVRFVDYDGEIYIVKLPKR